MLESQTPRRLASVPRARRPTTPPACRPAGRGRRPSRPAGGPAEPAPAPASRSDRPPPRTRPASRGRSGWPGQRRGGVAFAGDPSAPNSRAMNTVLYQALFGRLCPACCRPRRDPAAGDHRRWRDWLIDHVTGGAPVPTVRVGAQPYGIMPCGRSPGRRRQRRRQSRTHRAVPAGDWRASVPNVPTLDPDATDLARRPPTRSTRCRRSWQPAPPSTRLPDVRGRRRDWRFCSSPSAVQGRPDNDRAAPAAPMGPLPAGRRPPRPFADIHDQRVLERDAPVIDEAEYASRTRDRRRDRAGDARPGRQHDQPVQTGSPPGPDRAVGIPSTAAWSANH